MNPVNNNSGRLALIARVLRMLLRSGIPGINRTTRLLANHFATLQAVPIDIANQKAVFMDLREWDAHEWLKRSPWPSSPREPEEQRVFRLLVSEGQVVYDVGANIGMHTTLLASLVGSSGHVYAFEPNPAMVRLLRHTLDGLQNARLFPVALSDRAGEAKLFIPEDSTLTSLANWTAGRFKTVERICTLITMDELARTEGLRQPDFIKCDVEGAELDVFLGAKELLNRPDAPIVLFESNVHTSKGFGRPISAARDFLASLERANFQFFKLQDNALVPSVDLDPVHSNSIAIPRRRCAQLF